MTERWRDTRSDQKLCAAIPIPELPKARSRLAVNADDSMAIGEAPGGSYLFALHLGFTGSSEWGFVGLAGHPGSRYAPALSSDGDA